MHTETFTPTLIYAILYMFKGVAALPVRLLKTERYYFGMVPPSEPINLKLKAAILA